MQCQFDTKKGCLQLLFDRSLKGQSVCQRFGYELKLFDFSMI